MQQLGEQLTAEEFGEWQVMYSKERWGGAQARFRHAQLVVAAMLGPRTRADGQEWVTSHVTGATDPWAPLPPVRPVKQPSIAQQVRAINAARKRSR